jgi:GTP-binding protein
MFLDHTKVFVKAGDGGNGCLAFRREKFVPRGGPSGGDGGDGGSVYFRSTNHLNTLLPFRYKREFKAGSGSHGSGSQRHGKKGKDLVIDLPVGTQIYLESTRELLFDLDQPGRNRLVAKGGRGGRGNAAFATSTNQAPRKWESGRAGEEKHLLLELKVLADVGLVGLPNAGKSTLISVISSARPKIADYPFTTLTPNLGTVSLAGFRTCVVADIPGLIKGAHEGHGLGDQFLRHIERCRVLLHLVDVTDFGPEDPVIAVRTVQEELALYGAALPAKPQMVAASKMDAANLAKVRRLQEYCSREGVPFGCISSVRGDGIQELKRSLAEQLGVVKG